MKAKNIVLIGMMATGKSTVGKLLAKQLGYAFLDTDQYIEDKLGLKIHEIFQRWGEASFRQLEAETVSELSQLKHHVIATGGGMFINSVNQEGLLELGLVIHLAADGGWIINNLENSKTVRPLLATRDYKERVYTLLKERTPIYSKAHLTINVMNKSPFEIVKEIIENYSN